MKKALIKRLTRDNFYMYGTFANMLNPQAEKLGSEPVEFFRDMAGFSLGQNTIPSFSICRVLDRSKIIDTVEYHDYTGEGILPLDGDVLIHVAPASVRGEISSDKIEIFHVPKGTFVALHPGVWHHAPFALNCSSVNVLIVLPERTYANDCYVCELPPEHHIEVDLNMI